MTRAALDLLISVERVTRRGRAVLLVHDASAAPTGDFNVKGYRLSLGAREAAKAEKWDTAS